MSARIVSNRLYAYIAKSGLLTQSFRLPAPAGAIDSVCIRSYCRYPRRYIRNPVPFSRRLDPLNPEMTEKNPRSLDSPDYFEDAQAADSSAEDRDTLYRSIEIETRSHDRAVLKSYETFALMAAKYFNLTVESVYAPPEPYIRWFRTVLRSVHIFKKRRFQYETRTYYLRFTLANLTGSTADTYLEYIERNLPEGVGMRVMKRILIDRPDYMKESAANVV